MGEYRSRSIDVKVYSGLPIDQIFVSFNGVAFSRTRCKSCDGHLCEDVEASMGVLGAVQSPIDHNAISTKSADGIFEQRKIEFELRPSRPLGD